MSASMQQLQPPPTVQSQNQHLFAPTTVVPPARVGFSGPVATAGGNGSFQTVNEQQGLPMAPQQAPARPSQQQQLLSMQDQSESQHTTLSQKHDQHAVPSQQPQQLQSQTQQQAHQGQPQAHFHSLQV